MAEIGDRVQVPSKRVGQAPRDGVVMAVSGGLLRVRWSSGEESTISPSMGSLLVVGRARLGAGKGGASGSSKTASKKAAKSAKAHSKKGSDKSPRAASKRSGVAKSPKRASAKR
jgi:hypothetical protein